jgi:hypothetical protein
MDVLEVGYQLTEFPEIEEDDFPCATICANPLFPDRHSLQKIEEHALKEQLVIAAERYPLEDSLEEFDTSINLFLFQPRKSPG